MHQNLAFLGLLFLFLIYLAFSEKREELPFHWDPQQNHSHMSDFIEEEELAPNNSNFPETLSI